MSEERNLSQEHIEIAIKTGDDTRALACASISIAISLQRIADAAERLAGCINDRGDGEFRVETR